ncbi:hypothetical protein [Streptomyces beijiangensis]|uniref:Uncharacterized protein n=1 Tax=Streptomyces beijiangensis TaxID=163361 RepID=A0A939F4T5_9ACTN|nr:hypothetical protein [Streptomyces beijiangensis]MBO0511901.1 hypothetical protein [Streptomyces beijiangensis]
MSSGQKTVTAFLTLISALLFVILGICGSWPPWIWAALGAVLIAAPVVAVYVAGQRKDPFPTELLREPDLPIPPLERRELRITDVLLPSVSEDYDFLFSATIRWCPVPVPTGSAPINASGLAVDAVLERARQVTAVRKPSRSSLVQHELNGVLGVMADDATGRVEALALDVTLTLSDQDRDRLAKLAAVRKDEAVWEHERKYEQSRRTYLGDDVLKNTGSAMVWWLHRNDDQVDKAVKDLGLLAQLTSAANNQDIDERYRHLIEGPPEHGPDDPSAGGPAFSPGLDGPPRPPGAASLYPPSGTGPGAAFFWLLHTVGVSPDDPVATLLADQVTDLLGHVEGDPAAEIRERFSPRPPEREGKGTGPTAAPPPPESLFPQ